MKKLIILLTFLLSQLTFVYGQNQLEIAILNEVNTYRISKGLQAINFDSWIFEQAEKHTFYCTKVGYIYHSEDIDVKGHEETTRLGARIYRTNNYDKDKVVRCYENLALLSSLNINDLTPKTTKEIAERVLEMWIASPTHLEILNKKGDINEYFKGAVSIETSLNHPYEHLKEIPYIYVTLNYVKYVHINN
jgi:uncharacterized protein YkwD